MFSGRSNKLHAVLAKATGRKLKQWDTERKIETLYHKIAQVREVNTIWQLDKAVDLAEFYCDSHVIFEKTRMILGQLSDLPTTDHILIEGIAGQGKSILLRYLCATELARGKCIPVFLELRRIDTAHSLEQRIFAAFQALGLSVDDELFRVLAESGKIILLLDAFDEIPEDLKISVLTDIEDLAATADNLRIVVTTRPDPGIRGSRHFTMVKLDNLREAEYANVIRKLSGVQPWTEPLIDHIEQRASHIKALLCTPLMVTLLVLLYKSFQKLPATLSEFYDALFQTLLQRHDGTKPGFRRARRCDLDDTEYRLVFEALCILLKKSFPQPFSTDTMREVAAQAISQCKLQANATAYLDDVVKITSLILREGDEHRFIHLTVQEYHIAAFIHRKPTPWVEQFYARMLQGRASRAWQQELDFLSEIDSYRYKRYFLLPLILAFLTVDRSALEKERPPLSVAQLESYVEDVFVEILDGQVVGVSWGVWMSPVHQSFMEKVFLGCDRHIVAGEFHEGDIELDSADTERLKAAAESYGPRDPGATLVPGTAFVRAEQIGAPFRRAAEEFCERQFQHATQIVSAIQDEEDPSLLDGLV